MASGEWRVASGEWPVARFCLHWLFGFGHSDLDIGHSDLGIPSRRSGLFRGRHEIPMFIDVFKSQRQTPGDSRFFHRDAI